jgi:hypothetical protein
VEAVIIPGKNTSCRMINMSIIATSNGMVK